VDESLPAETKAGLRGWGWNAVAAVDVGLGGRSDEDVFSYAWRERRVILTSDEDFLDDARFPSHRNPGVIVVPSTALLRSQAFLVGIYNGVHTIGPFADCYVGSKIRALSNGEITIRNRDPRTGAMRQTRYRFTWAGAVEVWEDD
jgi:hypothetical protein